MSWERDPLIAKAKLFFERAFEGDRDEPTFGLWCSLGLELLARAAVASVSPTLLAFPDKSQKHLLYALNFESSSTPMSIPATTVFNLCFTLFSEFTDDDRTVCNALINRRNEELHSGAAAFDEYKPSQWLAGFYQACSSLAVALSEDIESLMGEKEADIAQGIIDSNHKNVVSKVNGLIAAHKKVFTGKASEEQEELRQIAEEQGNQLSTQRHHSVSCPACNCIATVQGVLFGKEHITNNEDEIIVRQSVTPTSFSCPACDLKLAGYAEIKQANLAEHYTRQTTYSPEEYYGLINPDDLDSYLDERAANYMEYDNE